MALEGFYIARTTAGRDLPLPRRMSVGASGADLYACINEPVTIPKGSHTVIPCGIMIALPNGYEVQIRPRSGLAAKYGVTVLNAPGTIDADYRGEICVILINFGQTDYTINRGDRIAQMVVCNVETSDFTEVDEVELGATERGAGGFGHTGR